MRNGSKPYFGLVFLTALNLFNYLDRYVLASVVPPIKAELQLTDSEIGWLTSAFMIGYFATSPLFGYLGDRAPRKGLIAAGVLFWSLGTVLSGFCHQYSTLMACRMLVGVGEASYAVLAPAWLSDLFFAERRNNALTIFYAAIPLGSALGYILGGFALDHGGWRYGFFWAGGPALLLALLLLTLREPPRATQGAQPRPAGAVAASAGEGWAKYARLFRIGDFNLILLGYTAYTFALGAFAAWGPAFLNRVHGLELGFADRYFGGVLVVAGLLGTLIGGFTATALHKRFPAGYALLLTLAMLLAVPVAAVAFLDVDPITSMVCLGAAMFLCFLPAGPITTLLLESVPVTSRASALAASIVVIHLFGDFWSPVIVGKLADAGDPHNGDMLALRHAMFILPAVLSLAVFSWGWLAWRQQKRVRLSEALHESSLAD